jgi:hypothetical protein
MPSTLDVLARGRYAFGVGAGWYETAQLAYDVDLPAVIERLAWPDEAAGNTTTLKNRPVCLEWCHQLLCQFISVGR